MASSPFPMDSRSKTLILTKSTDILQLQCFAHGAIQIVRTNRGGGGSERSVRLRIRGKGVLVNMYVRNTTAAMHLTKPKSRCFFNTQSSIFNTLTS